MFAGQPGARTFLALGAAVHPFVPQVAGQPARVAPLTCSVLQGDAAAWGEDSHGACWGTAENSEEESGHTEQRTLPGSEGTSRYAPEQQWSCELDLGLHAAAAGLYVPREGVEARYEYIWWTVYTRAQCPWSAKTPE